MKPPWEPTGTSIVPDPVKRTKTDAAKLAWLALQVEPSVQALAKRGKLGTAVNALLSNSVSDATLTAILQLIADDEGR